MNNPYSDMSPPAHSDPRVAHALREIYLQYNDRPTAGRKTLNKFGSNPGLTVSEAPINSWGEFEEYQEANVVTYVSSSSASDTGTVVIETMVLDGDDNFVFTRQEVELDGQTPVALPTNAARWTRMYVGFSCVGDVWLYRGSATAGVPDTATNVHNHIPVGANQSQKAATTVASSNYFLLMHWWTDVIKKSGASVAVRLRIREKGGVFRVVPQRGASSENSLDHLMPFPLIVPPGADIEITGESEAAGTPQVNSGFSGIFADLV